MTVDNNKATTNEKLLDDLDKKDIEIQVLKEALMNREARLMAIQEILNGVLSEAHINSSVLYKEINKNLTALADLVDSTVTTTIQAQISTLTRLPKEEEIRYSAKFRQAEGLPPITNVKAIEPYPPEAAAKSKTV